jgi:hypothetical protein
MACTGTPLLTQLYVKVETLAVKIFTCISALLYPAAPGLTKSVWEKMSLLEALLAALFCDDEM